MYNLNPKYGLINYDIYQIKQYILNLEYDKLLDLCPRIRIPQGTLFYHSTKLSSTDIINRVSKVKNNLYPANENCQTCSYNTSVPHENIGDKPRIMELSVNPNRYQKHCICMDEQQKRLYGNFNFAGNYSLELGKTQLKGTEILINDHDIVLIDLNYLAIELGFSPKRFYYNNKYNSHPIGKQKLWQKYCIDNNIDGLMMIDVVDVQETDIDLKTVFSCYNNVNKNNNEIEHLGTSCPEFVLIAKLGEKSTNPLGTDKLKILGMVDLTVNNVKLDRQDVENLFQTFFINLNQILKNYSNYNINLVYYDNFTLFKQLMVTKNENVISVNELFLLLKEYINQHGSDEFYINYDKIKTGFNKIYEPDINYYKEYLTKLELFEPVDIYNGIELYTNVITNSNLPKWNVNFYYKDNTLVKYYASDYLFDHFLKNKFKDLNFLLFTNYPKLSDITNYQYYDMEYYHRVGKNNILNIKNLIDKLEIHIVIKFNIDCYMSYKFKNITQDINDFLNALKLEMKKYILNHKNVLKPYRNKSWENFKKIFLDPPEKYICYMYDLIKDVIIDDNFMIKYIYNILSPQYEMHFYLDDILDNIDTKLNIDFFKIYINYLTLNDLSYLYKSYINFINNYIRMEI